MVDFENKPKLGIGIYTSAEIAQILRIPYPRVYNWMKNYWDGKLGDEFENHYSWNTNGARAVSFHTFVEFYVMMQFSLSGVKPKKVLEAHIELSKMYNTAFPFALKKIISGIKTDGDRIFLTTEKGTITLDGTRQFNLDFIKIFFKKLEFNEDDLASKFWPLGKEKSILIDPQRKFGHPVLVNKNIHPEVIFNHHKSGDPIKYIASVYEISENQIIDAIEYCTAA